MSCFHFLSSSSINFKISSSSSSFIKRLSLNKSSGNLEILLPAKTLLFANHQIYTDWAFIWYFLHLAEVSNFIYIILKDSLKKIPILGYGMQNFEFIFLSRNWSTDKSIISESLSKIDANGRGKGDILGFKKDTLNNWPKGIDETKIWPYSLVLFPEGTNLSANTRSKTEIYAAKVGRPAFKHVLLPKITGLRFSLLKLKDSIDDILDLTIGYSGVNPDEYGQDIYRLEEILLNGKNPETVSIHIDSLKIDEIPIGKLEYENPEEEAKDIKKFEDWVFERWSIKDQLMDNFYKTGEFEKSNNFKSFSSRLKFEPLEFFKIFVIPGLVYFIWRLILSRLLEKFLS
ncbi:hypothetical protein WICMUC_003080 [Wickerhamomyces mucosus]|uniref:Phospholipid/glycerol acyltransferase domain-containing protein n=1 Tax=Wickerhamomyces mucosus TaxID=1378264 RepID=A0A9P8TDP7_9ASCO|nr:hypothetical protein WICMUC_003080 [Wickerhamomyces mucosus]